MRITAQMLEFILEQAGCKFSTKGNTAVEVTQVCFLRSNRANAGVLYVADEKPARRLKAPQDACVFVASGKTDPTELFEQASNAMTRLLTWDGQLKDALATDTPMTEFLTFGEKVIPYPFALYDRNVTMLAASSNMEEWGRTHTNTPPRIASANAFSVAPEVIADLFEDDEYQQAPSLHEPFYFSSNHNGIALRSFCMNAFDGETYVARFVVTLPDELAQLHAGAEQIICHFFSYVDTLVQRYTGSQATLEQSDSLHQLVRETLFGERATSTTELENTLPLYGWSRSSRYRIVKLVFFESVSWESAALFICRQLETRWRRSCAVFSHRTIVWVVNEEGEPHESRPKFMESVVDIARTYACKAGISDAFDDFAHMTSCYAEAETALSVGQACDPHYWYYLFDDYKLDYLLRKGVEEFEPEHVASSKLLALQALDEKNGTAYVETLRSYLANKQNATHTAEALFMHRTSLLRRIERMENLAGIDFNDPDEVLYLELSLKLLGLA